MIKCVLALCAQNIVQDKKTNMVSAINIIDQFNSQGFPTIRPSTTFHFRLTREKTDKQKFECILKIYLNRKKINEFDFPINFDNKLKFNLMVDMNGLVLSGPGEMRYSLYLKNKLLISRYVTVKKLVSVETNT